MSSSFVEYNGRGFWSWDGYLEHVLTLMADRIGNSPNQEWLADLRDHWREQSSGAFRGLIHPNFDEFRTDVQRREIVLDLLKDILDDPKLTREAKETITLMEALLRGQMSTDAASELDYMVSGPHPYDWRLEPNNSTSE